MKEGEKWLHLRPKSLKKIQKKKVSTVELDFKNRQDKNQLGFKNQTANDQLD